MPWVGMRVKMADGYKDQGDGTIVRVPEHGVCSIEWDTGLAEVMCMCMSVPPEGGKGKKGDSIVVRGARMRCRPHSRLQKPEFSRVIEQACVFAGRHGLYQLVTGTGCSHVRMPPLSRMRSNAPLNTLPQRKTCTSNTQSTCRKEMKVPTIMHLPVSPKAGKGAQTERLSGTMQIKTTISREWPSGMQFKVLSTFYTRTSFQRVFPETLGRL